MKLGIFFVAGIALAGCAPAFDAYADARIAHQQAVDQFYDQIGYTAALEKMDAAGVTPSSGGGSRVQPNAYGLGMGMDQYGRAVPHDPFQRVQPNAYGLGTGMDQYGRAVPHDPF